MVSLIQLADQISEAASKNDRSALNAACAAFIERLPRLRTVVHAMIDDGSNYPEAIAKDLGQG